MIAKLLNRLHHSRPRGILDNACIVQHAGDGRRRNFGAPSYLFQVHGLPNLNYRRSSIGKRGGDAAWGETLAAKKSTAPSRKERRRELDFRPSRTRYWLESRCGVPR